MKKLYHFLVTSYKLRRLYCFLLSAFCIFNAFAQNYKPFPTSNAMWRETNMGPLKKGYAEDYQYIITGDTSINGKIYHKLQKTGYEFTWEAGHTQRVPIDHYAGCFRNDTLEKKIFFIYDKNYEVLLYDFNMQLGDTVYPIYNNHGEFGIITEIDTVLLNDGLHKRFSVKCENAPYPLYFYNFYIIEGIGSTVGLFYVPSDFNNILICFSIDEEIIYLNPDELHVCEPAIYIAIEEFDKDNTLIKFSPNPVKDKLIIKNEEFKITNLQIVDLLGRAIIDVIPQNNSEIIVDMANLISGLYFIKVNMNGNIIIEKIVKL